MLLRAYALLLTANALACVPRALGRAVRLGHGHFVRSVYVSL